MDIGQMLQFAGEHGPYLVVIALLLRSSAKKDTVIETLTLQVLEMAHQTRGLAQVASTAVRVVADAAEQR